MIVWKLTRDETNYGVPQKRLYGHSHFVSDVVLSSDGNYALSGSWDKTLRLWDLAAGRTTRRFEDHTKVWWCSPYLPSEPDCNLWKLFCIIFYLLLRQKNIFFSWRFGRKLFCIHFFYVEFRRGGLEYISCKYEHPQQLIYWLFGVAWSFKFSFVQWYFNCPGCA